MAEINIDKMAQNVAEKALDEFLYQGKSIREWMQIIGSEDSISRQAVFEQINCWIGSGEYRYTNAMDYLNKRIKALQAVNPQEKVGYWMPIEYPTGVEAFGVKEMSAQELQCSECGKTVDISDGDFKYCPYCKARMVEQESEG